jgi:hypothetical protein
VECRIQVRDKGNVRTICVAGRVQQAHVPDLLDACASASGRVEVDLTDVISADVVALNALSRIRDAGTKFIGVPTYLQLKLDSLAARPRKP